MNFCKVQNVLVNVVGEPTLTEPSLGPQTALAWDVVKPGFEHQSHSFPALTCETVCARISMRPYTCG